MDERKAELNRLRKLSQKARRRSVAPWKGFGIVLLILAILLTAVVAVVKMPGDAVADSELQGLLQAAKTMVGSVWTMLINNVCPAYNGEIRFPEMTAVVVAAVLWVLFLVCLLLWGLGKKRWKKTEEYLNYRTLKNVLYAEKENR